ncbi:MAG: succinate dehydrogenase assembly factor 2 [Gammaproteobacteria bacterium]|nr:succinate dehydrogenase assembly factor 2 [Gammaproteobacteria bacterium]|tara:strand:- start:2508 stop:2756 length:249 start_codon:yes stop_codon:yes gene_type:complete
MQISKIKWRCRKGLRELDILLTYFVETEYDNLSYKEKDLFLELIDFDSQELFNILLGKEICDQKFLNLIKVIKKVYKLKLNE